VREILRNPWAVRFRSEELLLLYQSLAADRRHGSGDGTLHLPPRERGLSRRRTSLSSLVTAPPVLVLPRPRSVALSFQSVTHRYGSQVALDQLDMDVSRGEVLALLGPNGAGKSTTISALLGLVRPQEGRVEVLGSDPRESVAAGRVGAMLQAGSGIGLPPGVRVDEVLGLVRRLYRHPAPRDQIVERANISALLRRRTDRLSGGQAQRVRFAIAIAGDPEIVFLDEPTSAMDVESRQGFWRMMRAFGDEGRTVLFATHHLAEADEIADRVVVLNHGKIVADGPGATLKAAVATRRLRFVSDRPNRADLSALEGITEVEIRGTGVSIDSLDADATIRDLVGRGVPFRDLEVTGAGLEQAFVTLTGCRAVEAALPTIPAADQSAVALVRNEK
jgi:ABC-2 type transport system ATP-binding protein